MRIHKEKGWIFLTILPMAAQADHPSVGLQTDLASGIITSSALPLEKGKGVFSLESQWLDFDALSHNDLAKATENHQDVHSTDSVYRQAFSAAWGLTDALTLGVSVPYVRREGIKTSVHHHDETTESVDTDHETLEETGIGNEPGEEKLYADLGNSDGWGDTRFYLSWNLQNKVSSAISLIAGIKTPTGETHKKDRDGDRFETELQPGSGSWDPLLGVAWSSRFRMWSMDANLIYTLTTEGSQETELGDSLTCNLSFARPIMGADHHHGNSHASLSMVFEINGEWRDKTEISGETEDNSGGSLLYFSPGLSLNLSQWVFSASVGLPYENLNGTQGKPNTRILLRAGREF